MMDSVLSIEQQVDTDFPLREIEAGGRVFSYRENGNGPWMVLLHGIGSGSGSWFHQLHGLADTDLGTTKELDGGGIHTTIGIFYCKTVTTG